MNSRSSKKRPKSSSRSRSGSRNRQLKKRTQRSPILAGLNSGLAAFTVLFAGYCLWTGTGVSYPVPVFDTLGVELPPVFRLIESVPVVLWLLGYLLISVTTILLSITLKKQVLSLVANSALTMFSAILFGFYLYVHILPITKLMSLFT